MAEGMTLPVGAALVAVWILQASFQGRGLCASFVLGSGRSKICAGDLITKDRSRGRRWMVGIIQNSTCVATKLELQMLCPKLRQGALSAVISKRHWHYVAPGPARGVVHDPAPLLSRAMTAGASDG